MVSMHNNDFVCHKDRPYKAGICQTTLYYSDR